MMNGKLAPTVKKPPEIKCLGPVADLESHLPVDWWKSLFNSIYLKTDGDVVENDRATMSEIDTFLNITKLSKTDSILDLCCGQGRHSLELAKRGYSFISGVDRSRYLVRLARNRATKNGLSIKFSEGDARKLKFADDNFDCVMILGNSFGYFEQELDDLSVLKEARRTLVEKGLIYLDITDGQWMKTHFEKRSWEWISEELLVCRERNLAKDGQRLISRELVTHAEKGILADQFYAERLYTFDEIKTQLEKAGFEAVELHENLKGDSFRNQDLGMMQNRMLITARATPKKERPKSSKKSVIKCTVLLGDPKLPDQVKREGVFSEEDHHTVDKMKESLAKFKGFEFTYFNDHKSFIRKFSQNPPDFVFNLCDEGLNNDPFMELHPPAFMEMLGIPYSGAGPECLSICYNKSTVRAIAHEMDIPVPMEVWTDPSNNSASIPSILPALVKPAYGDSSIGITQDAVVHSAEELINYFDKLKKEMPGIPVLVQEFLEGREFSVGIIGNGVSLEPLPILEVDYSRLPQNLPKILGYESKWHPESPYCTHIDYKHAELSDEVARYLIDASINLFNRLKCRDYARFDFRMNANGEPKLLEANPNPGWCWDGKMALMAEFAGMNYSEMLAKVLDAAVERHPQL